MGYTVIVVSLSTGCIFGRGPFITAFQDLKGYKTKTKRICLIMYYVIDAAPSSHIEAQVIQSRSPCWTWILSKINSAVFLAATVANANSICFSFSLLSCLLFGMQRIKIPEKEKNCFSLNVPIQKFVRM